MKNILIIHQPILDYVVEILNSYNLNTINKVVEIFKNEYYRKIIKNKKLEFIKNTKNMEISIFCISTLFKNAEKLQISGYIDTCYDEKWIKKTVYGYTINKTNYEILD